MNILVIIHNQKNTGPYYKVLEMCISLANINNKIFLLCTSNYRRCKIKRTVESQVNIFEAPDLLFGRLRQGLDVWNIINRIFIINKLEIDVIHAIDCRPVVIFPAIYLKYKLKVPLVISWWDLFGNGGTATERSGEIYAKTIGRVESFFEIFFRKYADGSTVVTSYLFKYLVNLGYQAAKIRLIRVGCLIHEQNNLSKSTIRKKLNISMNKKVLFYAGALFSEDKKLLFQSLRKVKIRIGQLPLTIISGNHIVSNKECKELSLKLIGNIKTRAEFLTWMATADFGLLPCSATTANMARWPSKVSDYFSAGLPIVATPVSDLKEINEIYHNMIISKSDITEHYSDSIIKAMRMNEEERLTMSESSLICASEYLNWTILNKKLVDFYKVIKKIWK